MKKFTLLFMVLATMTASAQTTFDLDWAVGIGTLDLTIEPGDTVRWTWTDGAPHTVTNRPGSVETFDSGSITGNGQQYSYTFTVLGANPYQCDFHPGSMDGTITVDQVASVDDKFRKNIKYYPNPVKENLMVTSLYKLDSYTVYNVLGKVVMQGTANGNITEISMAELQSGIYFVNAVSGELQSSFKITKQ